MQFSFVFKIFNLILILETLKYIIKNSAIYHQGFSISSMKNACCFLYCHISFFNIYCQNFKTSCSFNLSADFFVVNLIFETAS